MRRETRRDRKFSFKTQTPANYKNCNFSLHCPTTPGALKRNARAKYIVNGGNVSRYFERFNKLQVYIYGVLTRPDGHFARKIHCGALGGLHRKPRRHYNGRDVTAAIACGIVAGAIRFVFVVAGRGCGTVGHVIPDVFVRVSLRQVMLTAFPEETAFGCREQ